MVADTLDFSYNFTDSSSHNNGNVQTIFNNADWHRTQSFTYDSLNRIATAQTAADNQPAYGGDNSLAMCWAESFTYDAWGNLVTLGPNTTTQPNYVGCTQESGFNYTGAIGNNNRIAETGFTYDAAGNMTASPALTYVYDAENHLTQTAGVTYTYDGDGKRVIKSNGTMYWYGTNSDAILETDLSASFKYQYFFFGGQRVGRADSSNSVTWYFADHLGSSRVVWSTAGNDNSDFYPFGGERVITSGTANHYKFTGKERDLESGLDNFGARYNSSTMARFMSPDPKQIGAHMLDPQTLNRYAYARNGPLFYVDPDGRDLEKALQDVKTFASSIYIKLSVGVGYEAKVKYGKVETKAGVAAKVSVETSGDAILKLSRSAEAGVSIGVKDGPKAGESVSVDQTVLTLDKDKKLTGAEKPEVTVVDTIGGNTTVSGSGNQLGVGLEFGEGLVVGGEVGSTRDGLAALKDAASEIKDSITSPAPPPAPKPPPPPPGTPSPQ